MPELPEVETTCIGLNKKIRNQKITAIIKNIAKLRYNLPDFSSLPGLKIINVSRIAKYIVIELELNKALIIHLGMSGRLVVTEKSSQYLKHDLVIFNLENYDLVYNDPRRFGAIFYEDYDSINSLKIFQNLGPEPLTPNFNTEYLFNKIKNKNCPIKKALMDNEVVVGVGNIYACESLFIAGIHPLTLCKNISIEQIQKIIPIIKQVLEKAIQAGGSSLRDYVASDGTAGEFQKELFVYGKLGKNCITCNDYIQVVKISGRSSFFCPTCQL